MARKLRLLFIFGTRPEALKMAPVIEAAKKRRNIHPLICLTAQHRQMVDQVLRLFKIKPDFDLNIMTESQTLSGITEKLLERLGPVFHESKPDLVLVQGDTTTSFVGALKAFYERVPVAHIEAGLRSYNKQHPFPEELNRIMISHLGNYHFAPTKEAEQNLLREGIASKNISITGNTVVDAIHMIRPKLKPNFHKMSTLKGNSPLRQRDESVLRRIGVGRGVCREKHEEKTTNTPRLLRSHPSPEVNTKLSFLKKIAPNKKLILVTAHRRENFGKPMLAICKALKRIHNLSNEIELVFPVHMNPQVRHIVHHELKDLPRIHLTDPLDYLDLLAVMERSYFILTDSGGIQEEAPSFGKPVLVMREVSERMEGVRLGVAKLVGTSENKIVTESKRLLFDKKNYRKMSSRKNPYGDGKASVRILDKIERLLSRKIL